jgi:hypothetical protein
LYKQYLKVGPSKTGQGVFTSIKILAGQPVIEITGDVFSTETVDHNHPAVLQVNLKNYIGPSGGVDDYINHSCNPNCLLHCVGNRAIIFSLYDIPADTEITFDYSTSSTDSLDTWKMDCLCNDPNCRKVISGFQYLSPEKVKEYAGKGMIPLFLRKLDFAKVR